MYELHVPLVVLSNRALQRGPQSGADPNEIKKDLKVRSYMIKDSSNEWSVNITLVAKITAIYLTIFFLGWSFQFENES